MKKVLVIICFLLLVLGAISGYAAYRIFLAPNVMLQDKKSDFVFIPTGSVFSDVEFILKKNNFLKSTFTYELAAELLNYKMIIRPGKYLIKNKMNNKDLVLLLRSGKQVPVRVTLNNLRTKNQLASVVSQLLEADSTSIVKLLSDNEFLAKNNFSQASVIGMFIPNTYEFYWNTSAEKFFFRMKKEYDDFWNKERREKAKEINLRPDQVITLASIVEEETAMNTEKSMIAGVYINRLNKGWKLEADPTLVYALGDFTVHRVLNGYKEIDSPYNTYKHEGLPPGPICIPSVASIQAVLNYTRHTYMFFCAKDDFSGYHNFASNYLQQMINAHKFQKELNKRKIRS